MYYSDLDHIRPVFQNKDSLHEHPNIIMIIWHARPEPGRETQTRLAPMSQLTAILTS